jgi:hypothetical protein
MAGLVPAIHVLLARHEKKDVDARHKAGHDGGEAATCEDDEKRGVMAASLARAERVGLALRHQIMASAILSRFYGCF